MPALALLAAIAVFTFEQFIEWKYGPAGIVGLLLLTVGLKANNSAVSSTGAVVIALLLLRTAL
ncbi:MULTISPECIES: hypothetical protein [Streptomyces]|uniref:Uncharacterized protein n=1 Tax=Streptomyces koelreuteriae TaxID=2838015 RepID=A0ABX8FU57_9ACTN|nr:MULTISPECIES: hypothetical protein [Streptomyces]QWB24740.1 hypothetical protein KJK29_20350 [Streptomyces koelreuteriae]UUA07752.1 hypothetical protein NNW98_20465 [Streptomyces koelreuteriae]UUA15381.1 hypothetical protein NNW99_20460 [Streptomyces sp. CRCS-T-1]